MEKWLNGFREIPMEVPYIRKSRMKYFCAGVKLVVPRQFCACNVQIFLLFLKCYWFLRKDILQNKRNSEIIAILYAGLCNNLHISGVI